VAIDGLHANLHRDLSGRFNFEDLIQAGTPDALPIALEPKTPFLSSAAAKNSTEDTATNKTKASAASAASATTNPQPNPNAKPPAQASAAPSEHPKQPIKNDADKKVETALQIDIAGIELKNSEIAFTDQANSKQLRISKLAITTGRISFNQAFDVVLSGQIQGEQPSADLSLDAQAQLKVDRLLQNYSAQKLDLHLAGQFESLALDSVSLQGDVAYNGYARQWAAHQLVANVDGNWQHDYRLDDIKLRASLPEFKLDHSRGELAFSKFSLRLQANTPDGNIDLALDAPSLALSANSAKGSPIVASFKQEGERVLGLALKADGFEGSSQKLLIKQFELEGRYKDAQRVFYTDFSSPLAWNAIAETLSATALKGDVGYETINEPTYSFEFPLVGAIKADWLNHTLSADINAVIGGSPLNLTLKSEGRAPRITAVLNAEALDLDEVLPAVQPLTPTDPEAEVADADTDQTEEPTDTTPPDEPKPDVLAAFAWLEPLDLSGDIHIATLSRGPLKATDFVTSIRARDGAAALSTVTQLNGGRWASDLSLDSVGNLLVDIDAADVPLDPLQQVFLGKRYLSGRSQVQAYLQSKGVNVKQWQRQLDGQINLQINDGAIYGLDLLPFIENIDKRVLDVLAGKAKSVSKSASLAKRTQFASFKLGAQFEKGVGQISPLQLDATDFTLEGSQPAQLNLRNEQVDLLCYIRLKPEKLSGSRGIQSVLGQLKLPLNVSGSLQKPNYTLQWQSVHRSQLGQVAQEALRYQLQKLGLPKDKDDESATPDESQPSTRQQLKDLGKNLKGLFK
ncbi:MAG TPA: AsmA family protein, partial [Burkholderiaceae bacterium]|nr:AsmA family protein [Burkholderiaceae bacterium]